MKSFSDNELRGIITTDVMARGLDIPDVSHVLTLKFQKFRSNIFTELVEQVEQIKDGIAISFYTPKEEERFIELEMFMNKEVKRVEFPEEVKVSEVKIASEKEVVVMKNPVQYKKIEPGSAFHEKKIK